MHFATMNSLMPALLLICATMVCAQRHDSERERAIARIKELGGKVEVDADSPGKPVVKVFLGDKAMKDADLQHLKGLTKLQELHLGGTKITDRGLENLKGLTDLRKLHLDRTEITDESLPGSGKSLL